ncbi:MAG: hypothetical protein ACNA8P_08430 [Phycisphaerales bacterium]
MKTIPTTTCGLAILSILLFALTGCGDSESGDHHATEAGSHAHDDGSVHEDREGNGHAYDDDHDHDDEVDLEPIVIDGMTIELAQSHGGVAPGKEGHLVVKLPYSDSGATVVRAWIGTEDRTLSFVGRGEYAASHDDYDIHAMAPDPLPENTMWWIEIEKPDGTKVVGSAKPFMD